MISLLNLDQRWRGQCNCWHCVSKVPSTRHSIGSKSLPWQLKLSSVLLLLTLAVPPAEGISFTTFRSCADVMQASVAANPNQPLPTDGEYILSLAQPGVAASVYCLGFINNNPKEYLTLVSGRSNNFAEMYQNQGKSDRCEDTNPVQIYADGGRSEFFRIRFQSLLLLTVDLNDPTFAMVSSPSDFIAYGTAGDYYSYSMDCGPMGSFSVDLTGTPFVLAPNVTWRWDGHYADSSSNGQPLLQTHAYIGCFQDGNDREMPTRMSPPAFNETACTPDTCTAACLKAGFKYAGMQYGRECYCGESYSKHGRAVRETECSMQCAGDRRQTCGGNWRLSVYSTDRGQTVSGRCGGYPARCFPTLGNAPQPAMQLALPPSHPCLHGACPSNQLCVALTVDAFKCITPCTGAACNSSPQPVISNTVECPMGLLPIQCQCVSTTCTGARFDHDRCITWEGLAQVKCLEVDPGHVELRDKQSSGTVQCDAGTQVVGCSYWDTANGRQGNGAATINNSTNSCSISNCATCNVYARCLAYVCGCENGGTCNRITGQCACPNGVYGSRCETFDYCSYYEDHVDDHSPACSAGTCQAVPAIDVRTFGNGSCIFPFTSPTAADSHSALSEVQYTRCVDNNFAGPPFACSTYFDGVDDYISLGAWNPGPVYTIAAWVNPAIVDSTRRIILGAAWNCRDFGLIIQNGRLSGLINPPSSDCTADLDGPQYQVNHWYLVAIVNNGTHATLFVDSAFQQTVPVKPMYLPNSEEFRIGSGKIAGQNYKGYIKCVKIWKRDLMLSEIQYGMSVQGSFNSTQQALFEGLVAHYELGQLINVSCQGTDHGGDDWILTQDQEVSGVHCNVNKMIINAGITAQVAPYDGTKGGSFEVYAEEITIDGFLSAQGRGYRGGQSPTAAGANGNPGESYHVSNATGGQSNLNKQYYEAHRGGGGGGQGGAQTPTHNSAPGAGGGYATAGVGPQGSKGEGHRGAGGESYGTVDLDQLFMGSGGGSGGSSTDLTRNPPGGRGGNGGGIIGLYARGTVRVRGHVSVAGERGQGDLRSSYVGCDVCPASCQGQTVDNCHGNSSSACWDGSGPGGGGSGGSLYIRGTVVDVGSDRLWTQGGAGGFGAGLCGGDGSVGRVRVEAVTLRGYVRPNTRLILGNSSTLYQDLTLPGQRLIQYNGSSLQYGNEVFRGCYEDVTTDRHFAFTLDTSSQAVQNLMTPQYCMQQCRQRGYAFSAVEYGHECFCDNTFNSAQLRHENECNMPCQGDRTQMCGSNFRLSVYGPKPFLPVQGLNGALQSCTPWCLTGNMYSDSPSWGYCDMTSATSTTYNIRCQCPAGFQGANCDQPCPAGFWGLNCVKACICNQTNTGSCDPQDGTCNCLPGYLGATCDVQCSPGYYGVQCTSQCTCSNTAVCDIATGACSCLAGWQGDNCQFPCPPGTYGLNCSGSCQCYQGSCSSEDGTCSCDPGYKLPFCSEKCEPYNYGPNCMMTCDCHNQPCDGVTGICNCAPGYVGQRCEQICPHGFYGQGCSTMCQCQNGAGCDHISGFCNCLAGWAGQYCQMSCQPFQYGPSCQNQCSCVQNNTEACDGVVGVCTCKSGYTGVACQLSCPTGYYGPGCGSRCNCFNNAPCDKATGQCQCPAGFTGAQCQTACSQGYYGAGCQQVCSTTCSPGVCSKVDGTCICQTAPCTCSAGLLGPRCDQVAPCVHGVYSAANSHCTCDPGWQGQTCNATCPTGQYGNMCLNRCQCQHGNCNQETGACDCFSGYLGAHCDTTCTAGTYGIRCSGTCQPCGPGAASNDCDPVNGTCICLAGYTGVLCDRPCPVNTYGNGCALSCSCVSGSCNNVDGTCECEPGWTGNSCEQKCAQGFWGPNCRNNCSCTGHYTSCDTSTGLCLCAPGFTGVNCDKSCPVGYWGANCGNQCSCDVSVSQCSPVDGSCRCRPGFEGPDCGVCPPFKYGINCSQTCDCSGHGSCGNDGVCNCDVGFTGRLCQTQCEQDANWGKDCMQACDCSGQHCDFKYGICRCDPGNQGQRCDQTCSPGYYGFQCAQVCQCQNGATCDPVTGVCHCPPGQDGPACRQTCPVGRFGSDCSLTCQCGQGISCDRITGQCLCLQAGVMGPNCNITCDSSHYGLQCMQVCQCGNGGTCDTVTGVCLCPPGLEGMSCNIECPSGLYGNDCNKTCQCSPGLPCDRISGQCARPCPPGYKGSNCSTPCDANHFGSQCTQVCQCHNGATCDSATGVCYCPPEKQCIPSPGSCPVGYYGSFCSMRCQCGPNMPCDLITGLCSSQCVAGFMGYQCTNPCPEGYWDVNCRMTCPSSCAAGCLATTGQCKCTPTTCPAGYTCLPTGLCSINGKTSGTGGTSGQTGSSSGSSSSNGSSLSSGQTAGLVIGYILTLVFGGLVVLLVVRYRYNLRFLRPRADGESAVLAQGEDNPMYTIRLSSHAGDSSTSSVPPPSLKQDSDAYGSSDS